MENILTREIVDELGLNKLEVITSDMLKGYTSIEGCAFFSCSFLTSVTISNSVTSIGVGAFYGCSSLTSISLSNSVTSIGSLAFEYCSSLSSITIPNSVTSIGYEAFSGCSALTSIILPNSVTSIGERAFNECSSLSSITIPNSVTSIGRYAFYKVPNIVYSGSATGSPWGARSVNGYVGGYLVYADETKTNLLACSAAATGEITIPNSVTSIGSSAFRGCSSLTSVILGNSVTSICCNSFYGCHKLNSIIICDKSYETQKVIDGKCKAYKAFNGDLTCRGFQYKEGKTYEIKGEPKICEQGFHACLDLKDVFSYYYGELGKTIVVHEVELEGVTDKINDEDSKVVAKKITIGKRIL